MPKHKNGRNGRRSGHVRLTDLPTERADPKTPKGDVVPEPSQDTYEEALTRLGGNAVGMRWLFGIGKVRWIADVSTSGREPMHLAIVCAGGGIALGGVAACVAIWTAALAATIIIALLAAIAMVGGIWLAAMSQRRGHVDDQVDEAVPGPDNRNTEQLLRADRKPNDWTDSRGHGSPRASGHDRPQSPTAG